MDKKVDVAELFDLLGTLIWDDTAPRPGVRSSILYQIHSLAMLHVGHDVPPWKVTDPRWDGIGQLIYACNMVWRNNHDGWRIVAESSLALMGDR